MAKTGKRRTITEELILPEAECWETAEKIIV
jgi:hypothetical protein